ncbi:MAG: YmaF family protein [Clostridiales bacterium]|jgi:hypothetical protein|nr:YmaF family protein [Eubacteriales bacterium]MDH7565467.1 YmaF family protein [Clostridiales bacterium]
MNPHSHKYRFESDIANNHRHKLMGYTENMVGVNAVHFHFFYGVSSYNNHTHYFSGITGLPIKTENGHIHKIESTLEPNCMHDHQIMGYTFENVAYTPKKLTREAYI